MDPENEGAPEIVEAVVIDNGDGQTVAVDLPSPEGEEETAGESDAVRIAEIEGETTVAVAAIHANVEEARIEADIERERLWEERNAEILNLQTSIQERDREIADLREQLSQAQANPSIQTPEPLAEAEAAAEALADAIAPELSSTPEYTPDPTSSEATELTPSEEDERPEAVAVAVAVPARKRRRLI